MPTISQFFGVIIRTLEIIEGSLPKRAQAMELEWATQHQEELEVG